MSFKVSIMLTWPQSSTVITDQILVDISPNLINLQKLYLVGCPKVTHTGLGAVISSNKAGFIGLGIEGLSTSFVYRLSESKLLPNLTRTSAGYGAFSRAMPDVKSSVLLALYYTVC